MKDITIGIIARDEVINNTKIKVVTKNNLKYLDKLCNCIGIVSYDDNNYNYNTLKLCDGIIIQGGSEIKNYHYRIVEYALNNNIPLLGICMGNQIIGLYSSKEKEKDLIKVDNHYKLDDMHLININKNSNLFKIFGDKIYVNSRHLFKLNGVKKPFNVVATSEDGVIEAIEYIDPSHFILGVQWHPEDMNNMERLYNYFLNEVLKRKTYESK